MTFPHCVCCLQDVWVICVKRKSMNQRNFATSISCHECTIFQNFFCLFCTNTVSSSPQNCFRKVAKLWTWPSHDLVFLYTFFNTLYWCLSLKNEGHKPRYISSILFKYILFLSFPVRWPHLFFISPCGNVSKGIKKRNGKPYNRQLINNLIKQ